MSSATIRGRIHSRNPSNGLKRISAEVVLPEDPDSTVPFLILKRSHRELADLLEKKAAELETQLQNAVSFEFCHTENGLQVENVSPLETEAPALLSITVNLVTEGVLNKEEALGRIPPDAVRQILAPGFAASEVMRATRSGKLLGQGTGHGLGVTTGFVATELEAAYALHNQGKPVILVRPKITYLERDLLPIIAGFVVEQGPVQGALLFEKPGVVLDDLDQIRGAEEISLDSGSGRIFDGRMGVVPGTLSHDLLEVLNWTDEVSSIDIRANVTTAQEVKLGRQLGASGVGLCRIESLFQKPERLPLFAKVLKDICVHHTRDSDSLGRLQGEIEQEVRLLFEAAGEDNPPFTLRLLDVPLSQMLRFWRHGGYQPEEYFEGVLGEWMEELNPLGGLRFGRLSLLYPELLQLQVRAILNAWTDRSVKLQLMMPGVSDATELHILRDTVDRVCQELEIESPWVGSMLETPRACLTVDQLVKAGEFFSFGTGDLTEATCGLSRYDAPISFLPDYTARGIFQQDPFEVLDQTGVGRLMAQTVKLAKQENPAVELGTCGAQAVEESGLKFCCSIGLDYASVPTHHVPAVRLAAARVALNHV